jgi:hypothetical protein
MAIYKAIAKGAILLSVWFLFAMATGNTEFRIFKNSEVVVVIPEKSTETEKFAAAEFSKYLEKITGNNKIEVISENISRKSPEVKVFIGQTNQSRDHSGELSGKDPEAFIIVAKKNRLIIRGNCDRSTLYAVYTLLEQFGCRWPAPGIDHVPKRETLIGKAGSQLHTPGIKYRVVRYLVVPGSSEWRHKCVDWAVKNKINMITEKRMEPLFPEAIMKRGGPRGINNSHIPRNILTDELLSNFPEIFARSENSRSELNLPQHYRQFCFSEERSVSLYAEKLTEYINCHPEVELFPLTQGDGNHYCLCDNCKQLYNKDHLYRKNMPFVTGAWLEFAGKVAEEIKQTHPDKKFYTLAYHRTLEPSGMEGFIANENIMTVVVHHPVSFDQLSCYTDPDNQSFLELLDQWSPHMPGGIGIYDYYPHSRFRYFPHFAVEKVVKDIRTAHERNCLYFEIQSLTSPGLYLPVYYAGSRALWDPDVDMEKEMDLFYEGMYGSAAVHLKKFFQILEDARQSWSGGFDPAEGKLPSYITAETAEQAAALLKKALQVTTSPEIRERILPLADHFTCTQNLLSGRIAFNIYENTGKTKFLEDAVRYGDEIVKRTREAQNSTGTRYNLGMISTANTDGPKGLFAEPGEWKEALSKTTGDQP